MAAVRAARLGTNDSAMFVDRHSVAVTGQSHDDGVVCVTDPERPISVRSVIDGSDE
jgi:hypothetical protein